MAIRPWTEEERCKIQDFLNRAHALLPTNQYTFEKNEKNILFDREFNLLDKEKAAIIKSLDIKDCVDIGPNENPRYPDAEVFTFIKPVELNVYGEKELVTLYIKDYIIEQQYIDMVIVISFHREGMYDL